MGVLPCAFKAGESHASLGLKGDEIFDFINLDDHLKPHQELTIAVTSSDGNKREFNVIARVDTPVEVNYLRNGGILQTVLRKLAK
jgi:aconitate hydratase